MSPSDPPAKLPALVMELRAEIERTIEAGKVAEVPGEELTNLMSGAVRLYAARVEDAEPGRATAPIIDATVSTTQAVVVATALLRAHHLNPFDLALWFSHTAGAQGPKIAGS